MSRLESSIYLLGSQTCAFTHQGDGLKFHTHPVAKHDRNRGEGLHGHSWTQTQRKAKVMRRIAWTLLLHFPGPRHLTSLQRPLPAVPSLATPPCAPSPRLSVPGLPHPSASGSRERGKVSGKKWNHSRKPNWLCLSRVISTLLLVKSYLSQTFLHQIFSGLFILGHEW